VVRGIAEEIVLELKKIGGLGRSPYKQKSYPTEPGKLEYSYAVDPEKFKYLTMRLCQDAGVDMLLHTYFCSVIKDDERIKALLVENKSGRGALVGKIYVDASGDGDVAARAGAPFWQTVHDEASRLEDASMYRIGFGAKRPAGVFSCDFGNDAVVWGPAAGKINALDADELSKGEISTRLRVFDDFAAKQKEVPELIDARIIETPPLIGIRQTRFIEGEYKITADDAIVGRRFDDVIAISPCPMIHSYGYRRYLEHEGYDIPHRALVPKKVQNLLVAGRCISSHQEPFESHRAMVPVMAIGQAAGLAAAMCAKKNLMPRNIDVHELQQELVGQGAELRLKHSKST
jgi:hypothetical protein